VKAAVDLSGAKNGDLMFFGAGKNKVVNDALGALRVKIGHEKGYAKPGGSRCGVVDFRCSSTTRRRSAGTRCTTRSPRQGRPRGPPRARSRRGARQGYDMVLNGSEIGGARCAFHREEIQSKVFRALSIGAEEAKQKFGFLLEALQYGAPPQRRHRLRPGPHRRDEGRRGIHPDVIAFPKTSVRRTCSRTLRRRSTRAIARAAYPPAHAGE